MSGLNKVNEAQLAIVVAITGFITAGGMKFIEYVLGKSSRKLDKNRDEREEENTSSKRIEELWKRIDLLEKEVDIWRLKYYAEHQDLVVVRGRVSDLEGELSTIKSKLEKDH